MYFLKLKMVSLKHIFSIRPCLQGGRVLSWGNPGARVSLAQAQTMIIFCSFFFFREFNLLFTEKFKSYFRSWTLQRMSRMTKHVSKAGKVDPGDRE